MEIKILQLGAYMTNCYLMLDEDTGKCAVIDPADDGLKIQSLIEKINVDPVAVLLTHGHYDHILGTPKLQMRWPDLQVYCHQFDCPEETEEIDMGVVYPTVTAFSNVNHYCEGQEIPIGSIMVKVIHTPGHTPGSVTLLAKDCLFTGDTLFKGDIGRCDFAGGNHGDIIKSLKLLADLPGNYQILPGHEETSTLDEERRYNPYLKPLMKR